MTPTMIATVSSAYVSASGVFAARRLPPSRHTARTRVFVVAARRTPNSSDSDASTAVHDNGDYWSEALTEDEDHRMQASYKPLYVRDDDLEIERRRYNEKR